MNKQIVPCQNNWGLTYWNIWIKETRSQIKLWHYSNFHKILNLENFALNGFQKVFPKYLVMFKRFLLSEEMFETIIIMHIFFFNQKITLYNNNCLWPHSSGNYGEWPVKFIRVIYRYKSLPHAHFFKFYFIYSSNF